MKPAKKVNGNGKNIAHAVTLWRSLAEYDLQTAVAMHRTGRYLYVVFMCHQCIEKSLKCWHVREHGSIPPFTHNLLVLLKELSLADIIPEKYMDFIVELNPYNIIARYPKTKADLQALTNKRRAARMLKTTREMARWLAQQSR